MCGRFSNISKEDLESILDDVALDIGMKTSVWNADTTTLCFHDVRPSMEVAAIAASGKGLATSEFTWGLQAPWDSKKLLFNTRIEKALGTDGMWPSIANQFRCVVPAARFWERSHTGESIAFHDTQSALIMIAGIFHEDRLSLVTTTPDSQVARFHNRMPLCLSPLQASLWLSDTWKHTKLREVALEITVDEAHLPIQPSLF